MSEYMSFEQTAAALNVDGDALKRMVADGEIRAFRDEGQTGFKQEDVERLKGVLASEPVIIPPVEAASEDLLDGDLETVLNIEGLGEINIEEELEAASRAPAESLIESEDVAEVEEDTFVVVEDSESDLSADTIAHQTDNLPSDTISVDDDTSPEEDTFVLTEEDIGDETESLALLGETSTVMEGDDEGFPSTPGADEAGFASGPSDYSEDSADMITTGLLLVTILAMIVGLFACIGLITNSSNPVMDLLQ